MVFYRTLIIRVRIAFIIIASRANTEIQKAPLWCKNTKRSRYNMIRQRETKVPKCRAAY